MIRAAIVGYGNLGKAAAAIINQTPDITLTAIFSRRQLTDLPAPVYPLSTIAQHRSDYDILLLCLGSATDIPKHGPELLALAPTIDVYDNHSSIATHRQHLDQIAKKHHTVAITAVGWDPGLFSLQRLMAQAILPDAQTSTFWGKGVSQGHSDAIRRIPGVQHAVQYTIPNPEALQAAACGKAQDYPPQTRHIRQCYVVCETCEQKRIQDAIITMPDYFQGYHTTVEFITKETYLAQHQAMPHGGTVIASGTTAGEHQTIEYNLHLDSNPHFTAAVMIAYSRAAHRLQTERRHGAYTILDIPPTYLSPLTPEQLYQQL